ncbi:MAG: hypothetical protein GF344_03320 [Chitinivibrionales bacterium]|nr:hypothetical protein [Chitinivibrionales bacterium]MBD3356105.1 hypothetical protein [Chitinivibrionales bacterium]
MMRNRRLYLFACLFFFFQAAPGGPLISEAAFLWSHWEQLKPLKSDKNADNSTQTAEKDGELYRTVQVSVTSATWKGFSLKAGLPYTISQYSIEGTKNHGSHFGDAILQLRYNRFGIQLRSAMTFPLGYSDHPDSAWIGTGSISLRLGSAASLYLERIRFSVGGEFEYIYYPHDARVGFGSYETITKGYATKELGPFHVGAILALRFKSLTFKQWQPDFNGFGYGAIFNQWVLEPGLFAGHNLGDNVAVSLGVNRSALHSQAPQAFSVWLEMKAELAK